MVSEKELIKAAQIAREQAYVPYSHFAVGAALLTQTGQIYTGCNIENSSFSLTNCAERTAMFKAISAGERDFANLTVIADTAAPVSPCGACRQVLAEFCAPDMPVILTNLHGAVQHTTVAELLPYAFKGEQMSDGQ
ncbi:MAG: cytidine deaminase [Schleiferilactobacillus harbinensis]